MTETDPTTPGPRLPGRLGDPERSPKTDPRADPRIVATLAAVQLDGLAPPAAVTVDSSYEEVLEFCAAAEEGYAQMFTAFAAKIGEVDGVLRHTETLAGKGGHEVTVYVSKPADAEAPLPGILHLHGGGMMILEAANPMYRAWRDRLAARGTVVVGVEFRNGAGKLGPHPFPAGRDDCVSALEWMHENRAALGIGSITVSGESGGGNLTLATALEANATGRMGAIDGIYAMCPYISNAWAGSNKDLELPSLWENDGYFLDCEMMGAMGMAYDPQGAHRGDARCWPYYATVDDVAGFPPTVISVNELDPLRDEGLAFYRTLLSAGVRARGRIVAGTTHAGDLMFPVSAPDLAENTLDDIVAFARSL
jgi:acetyl esterase